MWMSKEEYDESGPSIVHRKCFGGGGDTFVPVRQADYGKVLHSEAVSIESILQEAALSSSGSNNNNSEVAVKPSSAPVETRPLRNPNSLRVALGRSIVHSPVQIFAGDPIRCGKCNGVVFSAEQNNNNNNNDFSCCAFCGTKIDAPFEVEELPRKMADFLVEVAQQQERKLAVFCLDISGSMSATMEVPAGLKLSNLNRATQRREQLQRELAAFIEQGANQAFGNNGGKNYVSRLECVQASAHHAIMELAKRFPDHVPVLITFAGDVRCFTLNGQVVLAGDVLSDLERMIEAGRGTVLQQQGGGEVAAQAMVEQLYALEEGGATALGPALAMAIGVASRAKGSTVVKKTKKVFVLLLFFFFNLQKKKFMLTDGLSNVGLGDLEGAAPPAGVYNELGQRAAQAGVSVSLISIRGDDTRMDLLGAVAELSGGTVDIVDPTALEKRLGTLTQPVVATNVVVEIRGSPGVTFADPTTGKRGSVVSATLATVKEVSDVFFAYELDADGFDDKKPAVVQVEMSFSTLKGDRINRCVTVPLPAANTSRSKVEKECNLIVPAIVSLREAARLASQHSIMGARLVLISTLRMLQRGMGSVQAQRAYLQYVKVAERLDGFLRELASRADVEKLFLQNNEEQQQQLDDYASRNVIQVKQMSLAEWNAAAEVVVANEELIEWSSPSSSFWGQFVEQEEIFQEEIDDGIACMAMQQARIWTDAINNKEIGEESHITAAAFHSAKLICLT
jgi:Mg-chelatase subunit ChlD/uncharacterized protein YdbL (DUF1318 family)